MNVSSHFDTAKYENTLKKIDVSKDEKNSQTGKRSLRIHVLELKVHVTTSYFVHNYEQVA